MRGGRCRTRGLCRPWGVCVTDVYRHPVTCGLASINDSRSPSWSEGPALIPFLKYSHLFVHCTGAVEQTAGNAKESRNRDAYLYCEDQCQKNKGQRKEGEWERARGRRQVFSFLIMVKGQLRAECCCWEIVGNAQCE